MRLRRRNVLREIRRQQRDPYRVRLKPSAPQANDQRQLSLAVISAMPLSIPLTITLSDYLDPQPGKPRAHDSERNC